MWLLFKFKSSYFCCYDYNYILISVTCDKEFWSRSSDSVTACFNTLNPSTFNVELVVFLTGTQLFLDWDSWFFLRWVPSLAITTSNKITVTALYKSGTCTCRKQKVIGNEQDRLFWRKVKRVKMERVGRCMVTLLPNFLGWVVYLIFLPMVLRCARFARESSAIMHS